MTIETFSLCEAAHWVGVHRAAIVGAIRDGRLRATKVKPGPNCNHFYKIARADLEQFWESFTALKAKARAAVDNGGQGKQQPEATADINDVDGAFTVPEWLMRQSVTKCNASARTQPSNSSRQVSLTPILG
jgi:excisionase family DNA binding protein